MSDLSSLIERVEAATGGDRELDAGIWLACTPGATRNKWSYVHKATGRECTVDETRDATDRLIIVPEYTTSIDAALTLLPEGRAIRREYLPAATWPHRVWIYKDSFMPLDDGSRRPVLGKTEALALCAAALKAASKTGGPEHG